MGIISFLLSVFGFVSKFLAFLNKRSIQQQEDQKLQNVSLKEILKENQTAADAKSSLPRDSSSIVLDPDNRDNWVK